MTVDALRGKSARSDRREGSESLPIGEADANIFDCPACARPLAAGSSRCPGCGTRLLAGVKASKAIGFIAAGLVTGLLVGGGGMAAAAALTAPTGVATPITTPTVTPSTAPGVVPVASAPVPAIDPAIPSEAISALRQSTLLNQRLASDARRLAEALAVAEPTSVDIARALRALAATATFGDRIAPQVAAWSEGAVVSVGLTDFYAAIGGTAREGLSASLHNTAAYLEAGAAMMAVMAGLSDLDAAARSLAGSADIELPPLVLDAGGSTPEVSAAP